MMIFWRGVGTGCAAMGIAAMLWKHHSKEEDHLLGADVLSHKTAVASDIAATTKNRSATILHMGIHGNSITDRELSNHVLRYSHDKRLPLWVQQHLSQDVLKGSHERTNVRLSSDQEINELWQSQNSDYRASGWSRGHMAPAADNKSSKDAMYDCCLLSNIVPQDFINNSDYWNRLEMYCRDLTRKYKDIWVTSGPAFVPRVLENGKKIIEYEVIGDNEVAVPTHLYKVVVAAGSDDARESMAVGAFLIPNAPIAGDPHLTHFQVPLQVLEKRLGFTIYERLDRSKATDLCREDGCSMMTKVEMQQYVFRKKMLRAKSRDKLDKIWSEVQKKKIPITPKMQSTYSEKREELPVTPAVVGA